MTRKDYVAIAAAIAQVQAMAHDTVARLTIKAAADRIADHMALDNPRFDRARFLKACGISA